MRIPIRERVRLIASLSQGGRLSGGDLLVAGALFGLLSKVLSPSDKAVEPVAPVPTDPSVALADGPNLFQLGRESRSVIELVAHFTSGQSLPSAKQLLAAMATDAMAENSPTPSKGPLAVMPALSGFPSVAAEAGSATPISLGFDGSAGAVDGSPLALSPFGRDLLDHFIEDINALNGYDLDFPQDDDFIELLTESGGSSLLGEGGEPEVESISGDLESTESEFEVAEGIADIAIAPAVGEWAAFVPVVSTSVLGSTAGGLVADLAAGAVAGGSLGFSGAAIDGYIQGATVNYQVKDADGNWITVASTVTAGDGTYSFNNLLPEWASGRVVIEAGGYDSNTGQQVGQFVSNAKASESAEFQVATPLTMILALSGLGEDEFKSQLGISELGDLATFDPVAAMKTGNAALGEKVFALQQSAYTLLQAGSAIAGGGVASAASLNTAVAAVAKVVADNFAAGGDTLTLAQITSGAVKALVNSAAISNTTLKTAAEAYEAAVTNAITATNNLIQANYQGLAEALRNPTDDVAQATVAAAKAAASISQSLLLQALAVPGDTAALVTYVGTGPTGLVAQVSAQVLVFQEVAALTAANADLSQTVSNPVFLVQQALSYTGGTPDATQIKDLAGELTQISLAKLIDLNVNSVTLLGTNSKVELSMQGNGATNSDAELSSLQAGLFNASYTVTLRVNSTDIEQILKDLGNVDIVARLAAAGIDSLKPVEGTLTLTKAAAERLIDAGINFSTGTFQLVDDPTTSSDNSLSFADVQRLVIQGGLRLAEGTVVNLAGADVQVDADLALKLIESGASLTGAAGLSLLLESRHLLGSAQIVADRLSTLDTAGFDFVFAGTGALAGNGVEFSAGKLTLSGLTLSKQQLDSLLGGDVGRGLNLVDSEVTLASTALPTAAEMSSYFAAGVKVYSVAGQITSAQATQLLNTDSSVKVLAAINDSEAVSATLAMGFAARGVTASNVQFDIGYVKTFILDEGNRLSSTITVNVPFSDDTITSTDFSRLIDAGVRFQPGIGSVEIRSTDTAFTQGNVGLANQLKLVNAGLKIADNSAPLTGATTSLANAKLIQAARVDSNDVSFGPLTVQLSSSELSAANITSELAGLKLNGALLTVRPVSGTVSATQFDALTSIAGRSVDFTSTTQLIVTDAASLALASSKAVGYYSSKGVATASINTPTIGFEQAQQLFASGIRSVNAGVNLVLKTTASSDYSGLSNVVSMGFSRIQLESPIKAADFLAITAQAPNATFVAGSAIDLTGVTTTLNQATAYSSKGLALNNLDTLGVSSISLSEAMSLAARGAKFAEPDGNAVVVTGSGLLSMNQAQTLIKASNTGVDLSSFTAVRASSADLQNLGSAGVAALAETGVPQVSLIDQASLAQVLTLQGTGLTITGNTTLVDRFISRDDAVITALDLGARFASGTTLITSDTKFAQLGTVGIAALKSAGVTNFTVSGASPTISKASADLALSQGVSFSGVALDKTAAVTVTEASGYASLGIALDPTTTIIATGNSITFSNALQIAGRGGKVATDPVTAPATTNITVSGATEVTLSQFNTIKTAVSGNPVFSGSPSLKLAAGNADIASVVANAAAIKAAEVGTVRAVDTTTNLSLTVGQFEALATSGLALHGADQVVLRLAAGNSDLANLVGRLTAASNALVLTNVDAIKAGGASITIDYTQWNALKSVGFVATDLVTLNLTQIDFDTLNGSLSDLKAKGIDRIGVAGNPGTELTVTVAQAKALLASGITLVPEANVNLQITDLADLTSGTSGSPAIGANLSGAAANLKALGIDFIKTSVGNTVGSLTLSVQQVKDLTGITETGNANLLRFYPQDTVSAQVPLKVAATTSDLEYLINNSASLKSAGVDKIVPSSSPDALELSVSQLSRLLLAGDRALELDSAALIHLRVTNANDLAFLASNASAIAKAKVDAVDFGGAFTQISISQALAIAKSGAAGINALKLAPGQTVASAVTVADITGLTSADVLALKSAGLTTFSFGGTQLTTAEASAVFTMLGNQGLAVSNAIVETTFAANDPLKALGFRDMTGFFSRSEVSLGELSFVGNGLAFNGLPTSTLEKNQAILTLAPAGNGSVVTIKSAGTGGDKSVTLAEFNLLKSITGGKFAFSGVSLDLSNVNVAAMTPLGMAELRAFGIRSVDVATGPGATGSAGWTVDLVSKVQAAGMRLDGAVTISTGSVTLAEFQNLSGLGVAFGAAVTLKDATVSAAVAKSLNLNVTGVKVTDLILSVADAVSLQGKGLVISDVTVSGAPTAAEALSLTSSIKGFAAGTALSGGSLGITDALALSSKVGLGLATVTGPISFTQLSDLLAQAPAARFDVSTASKATVSADVITVAQAQLLIKAGLSVSSATSGAIPTLQLTPEDLPWATANAASIKALNVSALNLLPPGAGGKATLTRAQAEELILSKGLSFVAGDEVTMLVGANDVAFLTTNAASLKSRGIDSLDTAAASITLSLTDFNAIQGSALRLDSGDRVFVRLQLSEITSDTLNLLKAVQLGKSSAVVKGVAFAPGTQLTATQAKDLLEANLPIIGSPSLASNDSSLDLNELSRIASLGIVFEFPPGTSLDNVLGIDALRIAQSPGVTGVVLRIGEKLPLSQTQWFEFNRLGDNSLKFAIQKIFSTAPGESPPILPPKFAVNNVTGGNVGLLIGDNRIEVVRVAANQVISLTLDQFNSPKLIKDTNLEGGTLTVTGATASSITSLLASQYVDLVSVSAGQTLSLTLDQFNSPELIKDENLQNGTVTVTGVSAEDLLSVLASTYVDLVGVSSGQTLSLTLDQFNPLGTTLNKITNHDALALTVTGATASSITSLLASPYVDSLNLADKQTLSLTLDQFDSLKLIKDENLQSGTVTVTGATASSITSLLASPYVDFVSVAANQNLSLTLDQFNSPKLIKDKNLQSSSVTVTDVTLTNEAVQTFLALVSNSNVDSILVSSPYQTPTLTPEQWETLVPNLPKIQRGDTLIPLRLSSIRSMPDLSQFGPFSVVAITLATGLTVKLSEWLSISRLDIVKSNHTITVEGVDPSNKDSWGALLDPGVDYVSVIANHVLVDGPDEWSQFGEVLKKISNLSALNVTISLAKFTEFEVRIFLDELDDLLKLKDIGSGTLIVTQVSAENISDNILDFIGSNSPFSRVELDPQQSIFISQSDWDLLLASPKFSYTSIRSDVLPSSGSSTFIDLNLGYVVSSHTALWDTNDSDSTSIIKGPAYGDNILVGQSTETGKGGALFAGAGNDLIIGGIGHDYLFGDDGDDILVPLGQVDVIMGGRGADVVEISADVYYEEIERTQMQELISGILRSSPSCSAEEAPSFESLISEYETQAKRAFESAYETSQGLGADDFSLGNVEVNHKFVGVWKDHTSEDKLDITGFDFTSSATWGDLTIAYAANFSDLTLSSGESSQLTFTSIMLINDYNSWCLDELSLDCDHA